MGLLSKTKTSVSSVAYNIAGEAADRSNFLKSSLVYLNAAQQSIGEKLPRMYMQSLGVKMKRAYKYAASLPQGLPAASRQLWQYGDFEAAVQSLLDLDHGPGRYVVEDAYVTHSNAAPAIERYLNQTYGWDSVTGLMVRPPAGFAVTADLVWKQQPPQLVGDRSPTVTRTYVIEFRHDEDSAAPDLVHTVSLDASQSFDANILVVMVSARVTSTRSDSTVTRPTVGGDAAGDVTSETTTAVGGRGTTTKTRVITTVAGGTTTIRTIVTDTSTSEAQSRSYTLGVGAWPTLDAVWAQRSAVEYTYFPSILFRNDNKDPLENPNSTTAKQTYKLCSLLGIDAGMVQEQINSNPDVKEIDFAFLVAGANMNTDSQAEMDYLFRFWDMCLEAQTVGKSAHLDWISQSALSRLKPQQNSLLINDPESKDGAYRIKIEWDFIEKVLVNGQVKEGARAGDMAMNKGASVIHQILGSLNRWENNSTVVSIRRQINDTQYEELRITGAVHYNEVYGGKVVETSADDARNNPSENEGFVIPLHMGIFNAMPLTKRTQFAQECLYLIFNCYKKVKQKWYQTGLFKVVLAIVGVIIIIASWGTATPAVVAAWTAAAAVIGVSALLLYTVAMLAIGYLTSYLMGKWAGAFESVFGKKWAGVVMAVVAITATFAAGGGSFNGTWLQSAVQILDIASQLFTAYTQGRMAEMADEFKQFADQASEDQKRLESLNNEFFGDNNLVSVDYLLNLQKTLREDSPTVFLSRTLMTGSDVVDMTLGQLSGMADLTLQPRLPGVFL